jgi:anti-sigma factor RsiW
VNCHDAERLIHGYIDGELDLPTSLEVERHLQECPACAAAQTRLEALQTALRGSSLVFAPPANLESRIRSTILKTTEPASSLRRRPWTWFAAAAALILATAAGWVLLHFAPGRAGDGLLVQELVEAHVRSQMLATHLVDIESDESHTVKPWFKGKLDFAPSVPNLQEQGFVLIGGRLDYLDEHPAAALIYRRRQHVINLFIWRSTADADMAVRTLNRQGYHLLGWSRAGLTYWAVSDLNEAELHQFVQLIQKEAH